LEVGGRCILLCFRHCLAWLLLAFGCLAELPSFRDLEPKRHLASVIFTDKKQELGTYYVQNRSNVTYQGLSPEMLSMLWFHHRRYPFYDHSGIDFRRVSPLFFFMNLIGKKQGRLTITQQLALNLFSEGRTQSF